jgi:hypothetical protein
MAVNINIPSQVKTFANLAAFPASGAVKTIYIAEDTNKTYRWTGTAYVEISASAPTGLTIGTTPIASGTIGRVLFQGTGNVLQQSSSLFWDSTNNRLGIGTGTPSAIIHSVGSVTASGAIARGNFFNNTLVAAANNDVLVGLDIQPTFTNGAFTGVENIPLRFVSQLNSAITKSILLKNIGTGAGSGVSIGFNNLAANNLSHAFIKSYYTIASGMAMSFGTGGGASLTTEGTTALVLNADQTANFTAKVTTNSGGFQANGVSANLLMSDNGTPVITRNGSTGIEFLKASFWQTFSIFTNNSERMRIFATGNIGVKTTTDAGFTFDVNGTARVSGGVTLTDSSAGIGGSAQGVSISSTYWTDFFYGGTRTHRLASNQFGLNSFIGNNIAIGYNPTGASPASAKIELGAGTATAGTAPLKLRAGTNLTTPENGAFEYDGTNLYFTVGGVRKTVVLL